MILTLAGEDITKLTLGLSADGQAESVSGQTIPCLPEDYLAVIDTFLTAHHLTLKDLTGIVVASHDGSATALRVSHSIANALGFTLGIPLYRSLGSAPLNIILPSYSASAKVTARKKDALYRKT